jgi:hypothetical protein
MTMAVQDPTHPVALKSSDSQTRLATRLASDADPTDASLPSYTDLFGVVRKGTGLESRSVLSPAAYLVDLLLLQDKLGPELSNDYHARRPDVQAIPLDEISTYAELPHLELANAVMAKWVPAGALTQSLFPAPLPFAMDHDQLALNLQKLGTSLAEVYRAYPSAGADTAEGAKDRARLQLGWSAAEFELYATSHEAEADVKKLWGTEDLPALRAGTVALLETKLDVSLEELRQLISQDLAEFELTASAPRSRFFVNDGDTFLELQPGSAALQVSGGTAPMQLGLHHLDRLMRFVRLARRLQMEFVDLDWILQTATNNVLDASGLQALAIIVELKAKLQLPADELCSLWHLPKRHGAGDGAVPQDLFNRVFNNGFGGDRLEKLIELSGGAFSEPLQERLQAALRLSATDYAFVFEALAARSPQLPSPGLAHCAALYRFVVLARALAIGLDELFALIDVVDAQWSRAAHEELAVPLPFPPPAALPARPVTSALLTPEARPFATLHALQRLLRVKEWADSRGLSPAQLAYICLEDDPFALLHLDDGAPVEGIASPDTVEATLLELLEAFPALLLTPAALQTGALSPQGAQAVYDSLLGARCLVALPTGALIQALPTDAELEQALARGIAERLEVYGTELAALGIVETDLLLEIASERGYLERGSDGAYSIAATAQGYFSAGPAQSLPSFVLPNLAEQAPAIFALLGRARVGAALDWRDYTNGPLIEDGGRATFRVLLRRGHLRLVAAEGGAPLEPPVYQVSPAGKEFFQRAENAAGFSLPGLSALQCQAVFDGLARRVDEPQLDRQDFVFSSLGAADAFALFALLARRGQLEQAAQPAGKGRDPVYRLSAAGEVYFSVPDNRGSFVLPDFEVAREPLFALFASKVQAYERAASAEALDAETAEILDRITSLFERQYRTWQRQLAGLLGVSEDLADLLFVSVFATPDQSNVEALAQLAIPLMHQPPPPRQLGNPWLASRFRRLRQFALLAAKAGLDAEQMAAFLENQQVRQGLPETLQLPKALTDADPVVDAMVRLAADDLVLVSGQHYVRYSGPRYRPSAPGALSDGGSGLPLPAGFAQNGVDAGFTAADGTVYLFSSGGVGGQHYVSSQEPGTALPVSERWGRVRNQIQEQRRVDAGVQDASGRLIVFSADQYVRYGDAQAIRDRAPFVDETYPRSLAVDLAGEQLPPLPGAMKRGVDAAFQEEGVSFFFSGHGYARSDQPLLLQDIAAAWGHVRNEFVNHGRVDAALVYAGVTYLFCEDQYIRYSSTDYTWVDEGYPRRFHGSWNSLEKIGRLPSDFAVAPATLSAIATGVGPAPDVFFFSGHEFVGPDGTGAQLRGEVKSAWSRVRNNIQRLNRVDAALLDGQGRLYLFSADQFYLYSKADNHYTDESYPRRLSPNWAAEGNGFALPDAFEGGISAAQRSSDNRLYFFGGTDYARVDAPAPVPVPIRNDWGLVYNWIQAQNAVDAGFSDAQGNTYLFGGDQFIRYGGPDLSVVDDGFPRLIGQAWGPLPPAFQQGIEAAFVFPVRGVPRLYLIKGRSYVRYSTSDYAKPDHGYPKAFQHAGDEDDDIFRVLADPDDDKDHHPGHHDHADSKIRATYVDTYKNRARLVLIYVRDGVQWRREYRQEPGHDYDWTSSKKLKDITDYLPFKTLDTAFVGRDGALHVFSEGQTAFRRVNDTALSTPVAIQSVWAKVWNQFAELSRVDATLEGENGRSYFFCDQQYVRYTGALRPGASDFYVDDGYPRKIAGNWERESVPISLPSALPAVGAALFRDTAGKIHFFNGPQYTSSGAAPPRAVNARWGLVENLFQDLNRVDAAYRAENDRLYLFCDGQYTRYTGALTPGAAEFYSDEGYPKRLASNWAKEGLAVDLPERFVARGNAIARDAQQTHVFSDWAYWNSSNQLSKAAPGDVVDRWARVRNELLQQDRVDAACLLGPASARRLYLFSADQYVRYSLADRTVVDEGYPLRVKTGFARELEASAGTALLPVPFEDGIEAALSVSDRTFLFAKGQYVSLHEPGAARSIESRWGLVENRVQQSGQIDTAFVAPNGKLLLFCGDQYSIYSASDQVYVDQGYPRKIGKHLGASWPGDFQGELDVAFAFEGASYLFKGPEHVRISDLRLARPDKGYPQAITSKFSRRPDFALESLPDYWDLKQLSDDYSSPPLTYLEYLSAAPSRSAAELPALLSQATGWPASTDNDQISFVLHALGVPAATLADSRNVARLARRFRLADRIGTTPSKLAQRLWQPLDQHADLTGAAEFAYGLLKARTSTRDWPVVAAELRDPILAARRDALVGYLLSQLNPQALAPRLGTELGQLIAELADDWAPGDTTRLTRIAQLKSQVIQKLPPGLVLTPEAQGALVAFLAAHGGLVDANALYELLLTDVQMAGSATTSKVVEALASIQLYYHRALVHLEALPDEPPNRAPNGTTLRSDLKRWWPWMKHYRVWEANRKVFLHPESYIRPELRQDKSPEFEELEQNLLQDDITTEAAEAAYRTYLDKFNEVSRLRIAGGYSYQESVDDTETHVVLLGHTRTSPPIYYYRLGVVDAEDNVLVWDWWKRVGVTINAQRVQPVWAFNKLFLFWLETKPYNSTSFSTSSGNTYGPENESTRKVKVSIRYSFLTVKDGWVTPQTVRANPNDLSNPDELAGLWSERQAAEIQLSVRNPARPSNAAAATDEDHPDYIYIQVRQPLQRAISVAGIVVLRWFPIGLYARVPVGRLNAGLDLEPVAERLSVVGRDLSSVARDFPAETGITPNEVIPWGSYLKKEPSFPWFSFEAKGGTFLCRPSEAHTPDTIKGKPFQGVSAAFKAANGDIFVFLGGSVPSFWRYVAATNDWHDGGALRAASSPWGRRRTILQQLSLQSVQSVIVDSEGRTHFTLLQGGAERHFRYPKQSNYDFVEQNYVRELIAGKPTLVEVLGSTPQLAQVQGELRRAFLYDGEAYLLLEGAALGFFKYTLAALRTDSGATSFGTLDAVFVAGDGSTVVFTSQRNYVALDCRNDVWSSGTLDGLPTGVAGLTTAFAGTDGTLYFVCSDHYAEVDPARFATDSPPYRPLAGTWGRLPPVFSLPSLGGATVDGALLLDGRVYLFSGRYCSVLSNFDPALPSSLTVDENDEPKAITELFRSELEGVPDCLETVTVAYQQDNQAYVLGQKAEDPADSCLLVYAGVRDSNQKLLPDQQYSRRSRGEWDPASTDFYASLFESPTVTYSVVRLTTHTAENFIRRLFTGGVSRLLSLDTQQRAEQPEFSTTSDGPHTIKVNPATVTDYPGKDQSRGLDFKSTNYPYYWEIFFHIPYRIAQALDQQQRYADAKAWHEYVFDPTEKGSRALERPYWRFKPFSDANEDPLEKLSDRQLARYRDDPFDPHAIAGLRQIAYRKAFVMSYIDTLVNWGDQLFRRYTREDLGEASMLYVLAAHLLGRKPEATGKRLLPVDKDGAPIRTKHYRGVLALGSWETDVDLHELENEVLTGFTTDPPYAIIDGTPNDSVLSPYFFVPENQQFVEYWERIALRLERIRNGMNIDGIKQSLALFEPPIDVMALVRAFASGAGAAQALSDFNVPVPHYRFASMLGKARELTGHLMQLGGALLAALEKKDAEALTLLRTTQERGILELTRRIKEQQLENASASVQALKVGKRNAESRRDHYQRLLSDGLSDAEKAEIALMVVSTVCQQTRSLLSIASGVANLVPDVGSPFAMKYGGTQVGGSIEKFSFSLNALGELASFGAQLSRMLGGWERRAQDWQLQLTLASGDVEQVGHQIRGAEAQLEVARQELKIFFEQLDQNQQLERFYRSKFTNQELYQWMVGKLSAAYFQTYQLALDYAKGAQRALQYELGLPESDVVYVNSYQWDSLKKGLLAGEQLQLDLDRLERAHMDRNRRRLEITKNVSLLQLDPVALWQLKQKGKCEFSLSASLFEFDFPGHYCRQIKTIAISLPAVLGPYDGVNATLTQLSHSTLLAPSKSALDYLLNGEGAGPEAATLRSDWRPNQQVALSRGVSDSGLFQLNYQDERYLPFEGTGAISRWRLELNGVQAAAQRQSLTDIIVTVQYTAITGGESFADAVKKKLKPKDRGQLFNVAYDFADAWSAFLSEPTRGVAFALDRKQLPSATDGRITAAYLQYELTDAGAADGLARLKLKLTDNSKAPAPTFVDLTPGAFVDLPGSKALRPGASWLLKAVSDKQAARFRSANIRNMALVLVYASKPVF